jgi:hypothetical protein
LLGARAIELPELAQRRRLSRRVILLRRPIERTVAVIDGDGSGRQLDLYFGEITADPAAKVFEYAVLVTSLADEVLTVA